MRSKARLFLGVGIIMIMSCFFALVYKETFMPITLALLFLSILLTLLAYRFSINVTLRTFEFQGWNFHMISTRKLIHPLLVWLLVLIAVTLVPLIIMIFLPGDLVLVSPAFLVLMTIIMGIYGLLIAEYTYCKCTAKGIEYLLYVTESLIPLSLLEHIFGIERRELLKILAEGPLFEGDIVYLGDPEGAEGGILLNLKGILKGSSLRPYLITIKPLMVNILLVDAKSLVCPRCNTFLKLVKHNWVFCEKCNFKAFYINPTKYAHYWFRLGKIGGGFSRMKGVIFEFIVVHLLRCAGFSIKGVRRELKGIGEIDIIAEKNGATYLCECKSSHLSSKEAKRVLEHLQMKVRSYRKEVYKGKVLGYLIIPSDEIRNEITEVLSTDRLKDIAILSIKDLIKMSKLSLGEIEHYVNPLIDMCTM